MAVSLVAGAATAVTAAGYLDAKYHLWKDVRTMIDEKSTARLVQSREAARKLSFWYAFEEQVYRRTSSQCLWYRVSPEHPTQTWTWTETYQQACRWAQLLLDHGVQADELVSTYLQNRPESLFVQLACWAVGCAPALVNFHLRGDALVHALRAAPGQVVVVDEDPECRARVEEVRECLETDLHLRIIFIDDSLRTQLLTTSPQPTRPPDALRAHITRDSPVVVWYTSGTTGFPKACAFPLFKAWMLSHPRLRTSGMRPGDVWYVNMPIFHGTANTLLATCMTTGITLAIGHKFRVAHFWRDIHDSGANAFVYVGEIARYLLAGPPSPLDTSHKVKVMHGNNLRPDIWNAFTTRFRIPRVHEFFSSSEGGLSLLNSSDNDFFAGSVGHHGLLLRRRNNPKLVPVRIDYTSSSSPSIYRDPTTGFAERTPYTEGGEILVRCASPSQIDFPGYWRDPSATAQRFEFDVLEPGDCYYRTGDSLRRDDEGRWVFLDRLGDTYRWKSENVSTAEVAAVMTGVPGIVEANVYGVSVPGHEGKAGCAAISIAENMKGIFDFAGLLQYARKMLPPAAVPRFIRLMETLPVTGVYKQDKKILKVEGVDLVVIAHGAGKSDRIYWATSKAEEYVPFGREDWEGLKRGRVRL